MSGTKEHTKDSARVVAGLKAAVHNPNVSNEAKENAMKRLEEMGQSMDTTTTTSSSSSPTAQTRKAAQREASEAHERNVLRGYKAATSNPNVSEAAKQHAREVLEAAGIHQQLDTHSDEEHQNRVLAGYKAAIHNPNVSAEAKQHARDYLGEYGITDTD